MNTILAATDYSDLAENAVEYAAAVARHKSERLVLLNIIVYDVHAENARLHVEKFQEMMAQAQARLDKRAAALSDQYGITVLPITANSFLVEEELAKLVAKYDVYMVVMGMAEQSRLQEYWGNATTLAIKHVPVNILAVPANATFKEQRKVLFACDAIHGVFEQLLARIKSVALLFNAEVEVLLIHTKPQTGKQADATEYSLQAIDKALQGIAYHYENVDADSIVEGIRLEIIKTHADVLIMAPLQHGFWGTLVHRSKTRKMASGLDIPLLAVRV
jgi:nucleotide-binding universal stress UspA family protein